MTLLGVDLARAAFLQANRVIYAGLARPLIFRRSAQDAHRHMMRLLRWSDALALLHPFLSTAHGLMMRSGATTVGGVALDSPLILAAGLVKGDGFDSEAAALDAVARGANIMPGWRSIPRLVGPVEFGSFTRWPRLGNPGTVLWRDVSTLSTQNRVGLKNPGAAAAAAFLAAHTQELPAHFGINIAASPGVDDPDVQTQEVIESLVAFTRQGVYPAWFTLNLSCPNTEDDPGSHQTTEQARQVCSAAIEALQVHEKPVPLWVKLGPTLADEQYRALMQVFAEFGVRAVVATNTLPQPVPGQAGIMAGVGGGRLHVRAVEVAALLAEERAAHGYPVDVIGCGGVLDGAAYRDFARVGIHAVQYWSALVYRGPLVAALIIDEARVDV